jgi:hypothetical protein
MQRFFAVLLATTFLVGATRVMPSLTGTSEFESFLSDENLTSVKGDDFVSKNSRYVFSSEAKESARVDAKHFPKELAPTFYGLPLVESVIRFNNSGNEISFIIYSVGDNGEVTEETFNGMVDKTTKALTKAYGNPTTPANAASVVVKAKALSWKCPAGTVRLEWSSTRANASRNQGYRAEFIRVMVGQAANNSLTTSSKTSKWVAADQLRTNPEGDKWISTVPMVDQGQKGYCAVATGERVLRYYGKDVDEHELAQACQTDSGTSGQKFEQQMKRVATRFGLRFQTYLSGGDEHLITQIIQDYTRAGKKKSGTPIPAQLQQNPYIFYQAIDTLNAKQLAEVREADKTGISRLDHAVRESIDHAGPIIWEVQLGIISEPDIPQAHGGHIRLIIGYNAKTSEILYTDSWGAGHELKRMKLADAWAETFGIFAMRLN